MSSRSPLPIFPPVGTLVRIVTGHYRLDAETSAERTALTRVKGAPRQDDDGNWLIPVVGHKDVMAGQVKEV